MKSQGLPMTTIALLILVIIVLVGVAIFFFVGFGEGQEALSPTLSLAECQSYCARVAAGAITHCKNGGVFAQNGMCVGVMTCDACP